MMYDVCVCVCACARKVLREKDTDVIYMFARIHHPWHASLSKEEREEHYVPLCSLVDIQQRENKCLVDLSCNAMRSFSVTHPSPNHPFCCFVVYNNSTPFLLLWLLLLVGWLLLLLLLLLLGINTRSRKETHPYLSWAFDVTRGLVANASKDVTDCVLPPIHG